MQSMGIEIFATHLTAFLIGVFFGMILDTYCLIRKGIKKKLGI